MMQKVSLFASLPINTFTRKPARTRKCESYYFISAKYL